MALNIVLQKKKLEKSFYAKVKETNKDNINNNSNPNNNNNQNPALMKNQMMLNMKNKHINFHKLRKTFLQQT